MRRQDQREHNSNGTPLAAWLPVLAAMGIMVTGCLSTLLVLQLDEFRPKIGDVVVYKPGSQDADVWQMAIAARMVAASTGEMANVGSAHASCTMDPNVMAADGGSLVVEARQETPDLAYVVHWAGSHTSGGSADCGAAAELAISRTDLQRLANAAGGFGIGDKASLR